MSFGFNKMSPHSVEDENFWPSFADIMMLIVMVFLMVMVVLVIKNWDLVAKLKESLAAEQQIAATANEFSSLNENLKGKLESNSQELSQLQLQVLQLREELQSTILSLDEAKEKSGQQDQQIIILGEEKLALESELTQVKVDLEASKSATEQKNLIIIKLEESASKAAEDFSVLKYKYDKLVRPARSPKGKTVVDVSLVKHGDERSIYIKEPNGVASKRTEEEMNQILTKYQKIDPDKLYLKIIFPKDSAISHQEAWKFTSRLLEKYDYYYQK